VHFKPRKTYTAIALAIAAVGAPVSASAATLIGGGSPLVGFVIDQEISLFGANPDSLMYLVTSSDTGQVAFVSDDASVFNSNTSGQVAFANSDSAILPSRLTSYNSVRKATDGPLIQIPYIVTPITVPYVNGPTSLTDTLAGPQTTPGQAQSLALNDADLCGIYSGAITKWNRVTNPDTNTTYALNKAINVVYRSDNNGTTELLTRHLSTVCPALAGSTVRADGTTVTFVDSEVFTDSFPNHTPPASFTGFSDSGQLQSALTTARGFGIAGPSVVGYISPDYANTFLAPSSSSAAVNLSVASVRNAMLNVDVAPTFTEATHAVNASTTPVPTTSTAAADPTQWVPYLANPTTGYPVSGTSQILLSQCYADANVKSTILNFLTAHYVNASYAAILHSYGFDTVPENYAMQIANDFISVPRNWTINTLNIGNSTVCAGIGR